MENTPSEIIEPQKGIEEVKTLRSKATSLNNKLRLTLIKLMMLQQNAFRQKKEARNKVLKLRQIEFKLRQRGTMSNLTKTQRKELEKKVQLGLRKARAKLEQVERKFNVINEKRQKFVEKLESLSS